MKTAIWAAVSTVNQATPDKVSIQIQIQKGREYIRAHNHTPAGEYIVPGESRTAFISLAHAEEDIPQLHQLLEDASKGKYQLLWVYDLNRFRNLMLQVFEVLTAYNVQIYNHDDPRAPVNQYTDEHKNAARLNLKLHDIISGQEINTLQKHYREKMPARVTVKRLHPGLGLPPYGYRKPASQVHDRNAVLEQNPEQTRILHQIKDWFLQDGLSLTAIADRLNHQHTPSPRGGRWWYSIVRYLLANPYYAGIVEFGSTRRQRDKRKRTITRTKNHTPVRAVGIHKPLWSTAEHQRILTELQRRANAQPGIKTRPLSRLLKCQCGALLWAQVTPAGQYWRCSTGQKNHTYINDQKALDLIIPKLTRALKNVSGIKLPQPKDQRPALLAEIKTLTAKRTRWMDLYEDDSIDQDELKTRLDKIQTRLKTTADLLAKIQTDTARQTATRNALHDLAKLIHTLPKYIRTAEPRRVNTTLHTILTAITIHRDHTITLHWRT